MMKRLFNICLCVCALALASCVNGGKVDDGGNNTPSGDKGVLILNVATRTAEGEPQRDYTLCIYKNEAGKQTLVRKYDSSKADMQKPEYIWLLEGNYTATVESGKVVSATFNEAEQYYYGEKEFAIKGGDTATVDIVAARQNVPVEVIFDQTIVDGFHEGYSVEVKADDKVKLTYTESKKGFFIMPEGVNTLSWHFVGTFEYEDGEQEPVDKSGTIENVEPKKGYKLSFKFSKDASGFFGGLDVVVDESVEERDDHLAFNPDPELKGVGFDELLPCEYAGGERKYVAKSPADFCAVTLTSGDKVFNPVEGVPGITLTGLNTPELYVTLSEDFFYSLNSGAQIIELCVTDTSGGEARKELPYTLPGVNTYNKANERMAWAGCSSMVSATVYGSPSSVEILYREGDGEWLRSTANGDGNTYTATIGGLAPGHTYEYALVIGGKNVGAPKSFTLTDGNQIPNGDMETWASNKEPFAAGSKYWDSGNEGSSAAGIVLTTRNEDVRPGSKGRYSAYLNSEVASVLGITKFAAGNIFVGYFGKTIMNLSNPGATVYFGQPFSYNAKPKGIKVWVKYNCGAINNISKNGLGVSSGDPDLSKIFCCMCNWTASHCVDSTNADATTFSPSMENIKNCTDGRYNGVLYTAYFESNKTNSEWHELYIPFEKVEGTDESVVPNYLVLTASCSGYGDYFTGSSDSWMYIDDIELVY